jgi:predicted exporter
VTGAAIAVAVLAMKLHLSFDLSAFFPKQTSLTHDVLIEQVRTGPASRLLVIGVGGESHEQAIDVARNIRLELSGDPIFISVSNGEFDENNASIPAPIRDHYLIMRDLDFSQDGLASAIDARLRDLAFGGGAALVDLISRDPFLVTLDVLQTLAPAELSGEPWVSPDGEAVLLAETDAAAIDIASQATAIDAIHAAFMATASDNQTLDVTGVGAFSVELQETIRAEARLRSILASAALLLILIVIFRNIRLPLLSAIPLASGFLAGLTLVTLLFDTVHGITLAFGFTLLGIAVDYPLHLFSHARSDTGQNAIRRIWPTMRLGVLSTMVAYLALTFSSSDGLAQLGVFTAGGVLVASLATRTWLPFLLPDNTDRTARSSDVAEDPKLRFIVSVATLGIAMVIAYPRGDGDLWDDKLSSLSPVASERLAADQALRSAAVTADLSYQLTLNAASLEELLQSSESLDALLEDAAADGLLSGWQSITRVLPSNRTQNERKGNIPDRDTLSRNIVQAIADTPFHADAFEQFLEAAAGVRSSPPLAVTDLQQSDLRSWLDTHLLQIDDRWVALVSLVEPQPAELIAFLAESPVAVELIDFQSASFELMQDYRSTALRTILVAALLIVGLLWWVRGSLQQTLWIAVTVAASLTATIATIIVIHGSLTVIHMVALLLVLGLGLDYALFLSRSEPVEERGATERGVLACAASTTVAFTILAASTIPLLKFLGLTVAAGSLASFALAWAGSRLQRFS